MRTVPVRTSSGVPIRIRIDVHLRAYEVYSKVFSEQEKLINGDCRGGFSMKELVSLLYARSFPENEWKARLDQSMDGPDMT